MQTLQFSVRSDDEEPYAVTFERRGVNISAFCTCDAGQKDKYCDHRFALLTGDAAEIVSDNGGEVATLKQWIKGSDVEHAMMALAKAKGELKVAREKVAYCREQLVKRMLD